MDKFSIITPLYNSEKYFLDTFNSVINQSFENYEWIIIDDCSTDGSFEYVKELIKHHDNVVLYQTEKNGGSAKARNLGLKHVTGRYITFLDADDLLDPNYLEEQLKFIEQNGPIITAGYRRMTNEISTNFIPRHKIAYKDLLKGNDCSCLTTMYDREIIGDVLFHEDLLRHEDFVFWLEILKKGYVVRGNQQILATYRIHKSSKNSNKIKLLKPLFDIYHKVLKINIFISFVYLLNYVFYSRKKYRHVK